VTATASTAALSPAASLRGDDGWQRAFFRFAAASDGRTQLARQFVQYPFHITRPMHLDPNWPELATLVLQSTSGGLFRDDRVAIEISVGDGAAAQVTTQSATKVHSMEAGDTAEQLISVKVEAGGYAELINDALILFPDSRLDTATRLTVAQGAAAVVTEAALWHVPTEARSESAPAFAKFSQLLEMTDDYGVPIVRERQLSGLETPAGLRHWEHYGVQASVYALAPGGAILPLVSALRQALDGHRDVWGGVTTLPGEAGAVTRLLATDGAAMRAAVGALWRASRVALVGRVDGLSWRK
jgi:urease accessory protein